MKSDNKIKGNIVFVICCFIVAAIVGLLIAVGVFVGLNHYTDHGNDVSVPKICGMYVEEAQITLNSQGLRMEVIDSTYSKKVPLGTIVEQNPPAEANVKHGRTIYVIMNARTHRQIPMPELHDVSYRQAEATLRALGLQVDSICYEPSEYSGLVLDVRYLGRTIEAGTRLPEGTALVLVIGEGKGMQEVMVPDLKGQTLSGARIALLAEKLIVGAVNYDDPEQNITDDDTSADIYYVYDQRPRGGQMVREGSHIDLYFSNDPNKEPIKDVQEEEDFF